ADCGSRSISRTADRVIVRLNFVIEQSSGWRLAAEELTKMFTVATSTPPEKKSRRCGVAAAPVPGSRTSFRELVMGRSVDRTGAIEPVRW
ncbi:MAG: hypothetical protein ACT4PL_01155, partial [Phycisphaerales bacterium]